MHKSLLQTLINLLIIFLLRNVDECLFAQKMTRKQRKFKEVKEQLRKDSTEIKKIGRIKQKSEKV